MLNNLDVKLGHLSENEKQIMTGVLLGYPNVFSDDTGLTDLTCHHVDVGDAKPIKQLPYRINPKKLELFEREIQYMLDHDMIEPSQSEWSSPIVLIAKAGCGQRLCIDYRKVNSITKTDTYPIPRVDDCIDKIGCAQYVSKYDLLKGY